MLMLLPTAEVKQRRHLVSFKNGSQSHFKVGIRVSLKASNMYLLT